MVANNLVADFDVDADVDAVAVAVVVVFIVVDDVESSEEKARAVVNIPEMRTKKKETDGILLLLFMIFLCCVI